MKTKQHPSSKYVFRIVLIGIISLFFKNKIVAQMGEKAELTKVNIYADMGLHLAAQASINFEGRLGSVEEGKATWYGRVGLGAAYIAFMGGGPGILGGITRLTGKGNNHFEINGGGFFGIVTIEDSGLYGHKLFAFPILDLGYRYQKPEGGFIFRAKAGILGIGVGLGYAF